MYLQDLVSRSSTACSPGVSTSVLQLETPCCFCILKSSCAYTIYDFPLTSIHSSGGRFILVEYDLFICIDLLYMWQQRLCIACMLMHAGGNYRGAASGSYRGAARHSEHQRLFRPQPYQQRQHARTRIWNHPLFCLADKNASVTPRRALKENLQNSGLGEKIVKIRINASAEELHQSLVELFPPLKNAGGYEYYEMRWSQLNPCPYRYK